MDFVETYTKRVLATRLGGYALDARQRKRICADVHTRLASLLSHWGDERFRRTVLMLGNEEATFWEPDDASLDVRSLVVLGVRNSLIEDLNHAPRGHKQVLLDEDMPPLTGEAIDYFRNIDLAHGPVRPAADLFGSLPRRFPNAWRCLAVLAYAGENETCYVLDEVKAEPLEIAPAPLRSVGKTTQVVVSGIDSRIDPQLAELLVMIQRGEIDTFVASSFSRLTRNPAKLLGVLDHILRYGASLVTANYVLSATYVSRRNPLIRPDHTAQEAKANLENPVGLSDRHQEFLRAALAG
jgi:hypothetical protein